VDSVEKLVAAQIQRIAAEGVTEAELSKAKNSFRSSKIMERESALNVAESVHYAETFLGDPLKVNTDLARYGAVTVADIKRVAAKYLQTANSLVLMIVPPEAK
jgi:zinc protease